MASPDNTAAKELIEREIARAKQWLEGEEQNLDRLIEQIERRMTQFESDSKKVEGLEKTLATLRRSEAFGIGGRYLIP